METFPYMHDFFHWATTTRANDLRHYMYHIKVHYSTTENLVMSGRKQIYK